jgi:alpha-N-arabinofuranosidase
MRFAQFFDAIKAKYPELKVISTVGLEQPADKRVKSRRADVLDEHYYRSAETFFRMSRQQYDSYDRKGPEIFVGEWAAYEDIEPWNARSRDLPPTPAMKSALGDAAFMTAMERNADIVTMQCYAPLLVNVNPGARQWRPNLIGYDALKSYGSPSYYAIKMFSRKHGDQILKSDLSGSTLYQSVTRSSKSGTITVKLVNVSEAPQAVRIDLRGTRSVKRTAEVTTLTASPTETNTMEQPERVIPSTHRLVNVAPAFDYTVPGNTIAVLEIEAR